VAEYVISFTFSVEISGLQEVALKQQFFNGLKEDIKDILATSIGQSTNLVNCKEVVHSSSQLVV
jgi:hypothetical protein